MSSPQQRYYRPYLSDQEESESESEILSESESDSGSSISSEGIGSPLALARAGGPTLFNLTSKIDPRIQPSLKHGVQYSLYDMSGVSDLPFTGTSFDVETGNQTSILIINSRDRDRSIYAQPTQFTLRVPRIYKNITSFQILQLKLLSCFFYFRPDKQNTTLTILENGRTILNSSNQVVPNKITTTIRTGTYDIVTLLSELQTQLNRTPLFFSFPNGISDFIQLFAPSGDLGLAFNQPGDTYYDTLRSKFVKNPTMAIIVSYYFNSQYAGLSSYTIQQVKYAYYYPVLYECYLDPTFGPSTLDLVLKTATLLPGETIDQRILYTKQGLDDTVIGELINSNIAVLDKYRNEHTFKYSLVNGYNCAYETFNNRINISSSNLNTSLVNLINLQTTKALAAELNARQITTLQYTNLVTSVSLNTAVFTNMYNFLQNRIAIYFGIDFNTFAPEFFADLSNSFIVQNAVGATGVETGYSLAVLQKGNTPITSSTSNLKDTPVYWPNLKNLTGGSIEYPYNLSDNSSVPYNVETKTFLNQRFVDNSGYIYTDLVQKAGDIVIPIEPSKYTVFRFRSPVRQNLQVETLPLPYYYRYPEYNATLGGNVAGYFDVSYSYIYKPYNVNMDNIPLNLLTTLPITYAQDLSGAKAAAATTTLEIQNSIYYYKFTTPRPTNPTNDVSGYTYDMNVTAVASSQSTFTTPISMFLYHDRGAFMADISGVRNEVAYHYKQKANALSTDSSMTISFRAYAKNTYYILLRSDLQSFQNTSYKLFTWFPTDPAPQDVSYNLVNFDPYANPLSNLTNSIYANVNDRNFIRLPTSSNLMGLDPSSSVFNSNLPIPEPSIGYDISGVSTDLTDYKGYLQATPTSNVPFATFRKDPITNFSFQQLSLYDSNSQTYFYSGSSNTILSPYSNTIYPRKLVNQRQYKILHWYDYNYIPQQNLELNPTTNVAQMTPFTSNITNLSGYTYGTSNFIELGNGLIGFSFLPQAGVWDISSMFFKSAWNSTDDCSNNNIKYLGIFKTSLLTGQDLTTISLADAIKVLEHDSNVRYTAGQISSNNGFDSRGGTYYTFKSSSAITLTNSNQTLSGFTPGSSILLPDTSLYSILAFNSNKHITNLYLLAGSVVPYPDVTDPTAVTQYFGCNSPTNQGMVLPVYKTSYDSRYGPTNENIYSSQYEQSMSIGTQVLHYNQNATIAQSPTGFYLFNFEPLDKYQTKSLNIVTMTRALIYVNSIYDYTDENFVKTTSNMCGYYNYLGPGRDFTTNFNVGRGGFKRFVNPNCNQYVTPSGTGSPKPGGGGSYYGGGGGSYYGGGGGNGYDSLNSLTPDDLTNTDFFWYLNTYVGLTSFCTAFNSNDYNTDLNYFSIRIFKDNNSNYFSNNYSDNLAYLRFGFTTFLTRIGYNSLTYCLTDPYTTNGSDCSWAFVMTKSFLYKRYSFGGGEYDPNVIYPDNMTIFYSYRNQATKQMSVRGLDGSYAVGNALNNVIENAPGISIANNPTNTKMYVLPYDQYNFDVLATSGTTLYLVDLAANPNPTTSQIGFTQGTIVYRFIGVPNSFVNVNILSDSTVLLKQQNDPTLYYISSCNLITSNSNYVLYNTRVSPISQTLNLSNSITSVTTTAPASIFVGQNYYYAGDQSTIPQYVIWATAISYYTIDPNDSTITSWLYNETDAFGRLGALWTGYFYCYSDGRLYQQSNVDLDSTIRVTNLLAFDVAGKSGQGTLNTKYYKFPNHQERILTPYENPDLRETYSIFWNISPGGVLSYAYPPNYPPPDSVRVYGNRGNIRDPIDTKIVGNAWQIFYPNFKLNLVKKSNSTSPITNTTDLTTYPYYPHTSMFFYNSFSKMVSDISGLWAHEKKTNFLASDVSSGYFFMSYINTINLAKSTDYTGGNSSYNYLAIRGYSPTEKFKCLLRFYLPGRYDFGYMSIYNLMEEAEKIVLRDLSGTSLVNPAYNKALNLFNVAFKITSNFGANSVPGFGGSNLSFTGFSNFMTQYQTIYQIGASNASLLNAITSNVRSNVRAYISQYLGDILPPYVLQRDIFTASLTFSILFKSSLSPAYLALGDEWGLGYNLGFDKADTEYSTVQRATSFFKILDDYIYLRMNPEFTMNRMDTTALENLSVTHEPTGTVNQYAAKLLLAQFGNYATTIIQNPIQFNPVLQSLDRLSFQWTDTAGTTLNNNECEWNAVVQIQEHITAPKVGSTIPRPNK